MLMLPKVSWVITCFAYFVQGQQEFINFQPLAYQGNPFYQQQNYQPSFPPHFRPFGFPQHQQDYQSPFNKPLSYQALFTNPEEQPQFQTGLPIRNPVSNPYIVDYPNFYQQYPQSPYDEVYQDLSEYNGIVPSLRGPIQIIPSRFPPRIEGLVEKIQNRFSVYNPGLVLLNSLPQEGTINATTTATPQEVTSQETTAAPDTEEINSTSYVPAEESATESSEKVTVRQSVEEEKVTPANETSVSIGGTEEAASTTEVKVEDVTAAPSTELP